MQHHLVRVFNSLVPGVVLRDEKAVNNVISDQ